ncbi:hypothetical protein [Desulfobacca acetoxidans]|uniref:CBS domain-containing protein n=1 Tax=Desulfobacca acetoxidans (strain ATCC 700848 / DSM 11109 / ASRB2) TaxID=880072 RepID=F2NFX8_DESAR|nr:hypothetical protein [Desulfobacca acetoxidans]AEB08391.1 hypothetical protein Desac_0505 [Desulfobacca acetoxidans DSM 11109]HAY21523.1 hypothetical protein [Desulfobacterales bacterium]
MEDSKPAEPNKSDHREKLSIWITWTSIIGVLGLSIVMIISAWQDKDTRTMVFTAALPLFGAWVGTILAFYFGKENFEAATRSVTAIARTVGVMEKLTEIPVRNKMIPRNEMLVETSPPDKIILVDALQKLQEKLRLPILNDQGHVTYIVHRSAIDNYLVKKALQTPTPDLKTLTLQNLLDEDAELKKWLGESFATVEEGASLAKAKIIMDNLDKCEDIFVTRNGTKKEPVIGWVTNGIIQEAAKL